MRLKRAETPRTRKGALQAVADKPFGIILLGLLALGLTGYALWQLVEVVVGPRDKEGVDAHAKRAASLAQTVIYGSLSAFAWAIVAGSGESVSSGGSEQQQTATVLGWLGGVALVTIVGIVLIGIAVYQGYQAATKGFLENLKLGEMSEPERKAATYLGVGGHIACGVVFALIGVFLVKAALEYDSQEAIGLGGALTKLARQPYGSFLLGLVAAGLLLYGLYSFVESRYRKL